MKLFTLNRTFILVSFSVTLFELTVVNNWYIIMVSIITNYHSTCIKYVHLGKMEFIISGTEEYFVFAVKQLTLRLIPVLFYV